MDSRSKMMWVLEGSLVSQEVIQSLLNYSHFIPPDPDATLAKDKHHRELLHLTVKCL